MAWLYLTIQESFPWLLFMKIGTFMILVLLVGCSSGTKNKFSSQAPAQINDFYFEVLEIKTKLHESILEKKPWIALKKEPAENWNLDQISDWLHLRHSKEVERAKLKMLRSHLITADPKLAYTKDIEESCWSEVERIIQSQLTKTALAVSKKARLSPGRSIQEVVYDSIAVHHP